MFYIPIISTANRKQTFDKEHLEDTEVATQRYKQQDLQECQHSFESVNQLL